MGVDFVLDEVGGGHFLGRDGAAVQGFQKEVERALAGGGVLRGVQAPASVEAADERADGVDEALPPGIVHGRPAFALLCIRQVVATVGADEHHVGAAQRHLGHMAGQSRTRGRPWSVPSHDRCVRSGGWPR